MTVPYNDVYQYAKQRSREIQSGRDSAADHWLARERGMTEMDFGTVIDATIASHRPKPISDQALFLSMLAPWFALGFTGIGIAIYSMTRG